MAGDFALTGGVSQALGDLNTMSQTATSQFNLHRAQQLLPFELQAAPIEIENKQAMARLHQAQAVDKEEDIRSNRILGETMQKISSGQIGGVTPDMPLSKRLQFAAQEVNKAGGGIRGVELENKAIIAFGHEGQAKANDLRAQALEVDKVNQAAKWIDRNIPFAQDPKSWEDAKWKYQEKFGEPPPWVQLPWSPYAAQLVLDSALSSSQKVNDAWRRRVEDNTAANRREQNDYRARSLELREAELQRRRDSDAAKAKVGGKAVSRATQQEVANIVAKIDEEYKDVKIENKMGIAREMAERAREMTQTERTPPSIAEERAYREFKHLIKIDPDNVINKVTGAINEATGGRLGIKPGYLKVGEGTRAKPIKLQEGMTPELNTHYVGPDGRVGVYIGNGKMRYLE